MHFTEYHTRLASYVLLTDGGQILLSRFRGTATQAPCWTMPGGGVEFNESLHDAAVREVYEETGYRIELGAMLDADHFTVPASATRGPVRLQRFVFAGTITGGVLGTTEIDGTTERAVWMPISDVRALEVSDRADVVDLALAHIDDSVPRTERLR
jgi:8-oxo-dGTP diphosphatase